jgi:hypothetical protein
VRRGLGYSLGHQAGRFGNGQLSKFGLHVGLAAVSGFRGEHRKVVMGKLHGLKLGGVHGRHSSSNVHIRLDIPRLGFDT